MIDDRVPEIRKAWLKDKVLREELRSISYDQKKVYEGFAEGVRLWMTQPEKLAQVAPHFNEWFNQFAEQHEYGSALKKAQQGMSDWFAQDALTRAKSKIGNAKPINESLHNTFHNFRQTVSDDLDGLYKMERKLTGQIKPSGPYETARLTRGAFSMVEGALTIGAPTVNSDGSFIFKGKSLEAILEPVSDRIGEWTRYAVGRSAKELLLQNREHLFTKAEITAMLKLETPEFKQAFRDYQTWNKRVVDFAQALGIINPETRKLWRRAQYLPFYRVNADYRPRAESNVSGDWRGIQRLTGGTDNIRDVLQNMIQNASQLIVQAVRNEARASVADMADNIKGGGRFMVKIPRGTGQTMISKAEIMRIVEQAGIVPEDVLTDYSRLKDLVTVFQFGQAPKGKNIVAVMRGGKADYYEVGDPLLMRSLQALDRPVKHWITHILGGFKRVGQSSITLSLDFISANLARDTLMGGIMSKYGFRPFFDSIRGMKSRVTKDPAYQEFIANGGGFSSVYLDDQAFKKRLEQFYGKKGINYRTVIDTPAKFLYFLETLADAFEMSTRLGEFKQARGKGSDPRHAAYSAREVSTDFAMRGDSEVLGFFYDTVMFLKAGINGMDRLYRGVADDTNRRQIAVKTALLALASTALYALNRDNDLYDRLEDWDKDGHWHFFIPMAGAKVNAPLEERYHHFRYPKLWEIGAVSSMAERSLENLLESTPKKLGRDYLRIVLDQFKLDYVPQAFEPLYEQYLNRNRFTGAPIETQTMEQLAPFARSKHYTAKILQETGLKSRNLPRVLQVPPARTETLLRGYLNTWAMYGLSLADAALYDDKPDMRVDDYPVLRRFYAAEPAKRTQYETQFYDMLREATELRRTIRQMDKIGRPDIADEISNRKRVDNYKPLTSINEVFQEINREIRKVYIDDRLTSQQKREKLDNLARQKNTLLEAAVKEVESQESDKNR
ncbi:MAG: LPD38 domain-containing protein [Candidatus Thiodiazotropha sp. (ex. Lucinoma kazani)]